MVWLDCGVVFGVGLKVLEWEYVGAGFTGPIVRREAAKWGSRPSMSMAVGLCFSFFFFCKIGGSFFLSVR